MAELGIEPELYEKSGAGSRQDPEKAKQLREMANKVELEERLRLAGPGYEPLEKEAALKHIEAIEM